LLSPASCCKLMCLLFHQHTRRLLQAMLLAPRLERPRMMSPC
jgi:hypothetical protein